MSTVVPAVVVHIPHASVVVPDDVAAELLLTPAQVERELVAMTDRYTDELFALASSVATTVAFPVSRLAVDPERFADDESDPWRRGAWASSTRGPPPVTRCATRRPPTNGGACSRASTSRVTRH